MNTLNKILLTGLSVLSLNNLYSQDQNANKSVFVDSIMNESKKYPTTIHFAYKILEGSKKNFNDINKLEKIIKKVESQCEKKEKYSKREVIKILKKTMKEIKNSGLEYKKSEFDCDDISFIYLAVGEKFNLNLFGVKEADHLFIRYDSDGKHDPLNLENPINKGDFNVETTADFFTKLPDNYYKEEGNIPEELIKNGVFMRNLTKKELIALSFLKRTEDFNLKTPDLAIENYSKAIEIDSKDPKMYKNRGILWCIKENYDLGIQDFSKSIELNPFDLETYSLRGKVYLLLGDIEKFKGDVKKLEELR